MRVIYSIGPGDVIGPYRQAAAGRPLPQGLSIPYAEQFLAVCREQSLEAWMISSHGRRDRLIDGRLRLEHRPAPWRSARGLRYHLSEAWRALRLVGSAVRHRADLAVVAEGGHWWMLALMRLCGVQIVPSLHCVLWQKFKPPSRAQRLMRRLNRWFFRRCCYAVMTVSRDISEQVQELAQEAAPPIIECVPQYAPDRFAAVAPAQFDSRPFHVFLASRIVRNKGLFEMLEIARRLREQGRDDIVFDICGDGPALDPLRDEAQRAGLSHVFHCHGLCDATRMSELLAQSHIVVVPTTVDFVEGFNKVVAEGVLARRPVVTSSVVPALEYVRPAVLEVQADSIEGYLEAILTLCDDRDLYDRKRQGCESCRHQFMDPARSWGAGFERIVTALSQQRPPHPIGWLRPADAPAPTTEQA